jgi:outer membrane protein TolC
MPSGPSRAGGAVTAGASDYLAVVTSQTAVLQTELEALNLDTLQLRASIDLIRALAGGWEDSARAQNSKAMNRQKPG